MSLYRNNSKNGFHIGGSNRDVQIDALDVFKKNLERHFYSEANVRIYSNENNTIKLIIELQCNLTLAETLFHFNRGDWGNFDTDNSSFSSSLLLLKEVNDVNIDIEEFTIFLKDTAIIVSRIYENSISKQLSTIFTEIGNHYVYFTNGLTEIPYEIYISVFEDNFLDNDIVATDFEKTNKNKKEYYSFWGLYFQTADEAVIYDLKNSCLISAELHMLNH